MDNTTETNHKQPQSQVEKKPNENAGFAFSSSIKITDPNSGEVILQKRAD